jgi:hypothetical protein
MDRFNRYVSGRHDSLALKFDQQSREVVYVFDKSRPDDPHMDFIFTNKTALRSLGHYTQPYLTGRVGCKRPKRCFAAC